MARLSLALLGLLSSADAAAWRSVSILDFGAVGDNRTDCTAAFRAATAAVVSGGGGEVLVPAPGVFKTGPFNLTTNTRLRVEGTIFAIEDAAAFPMVAALPSYSDSPGQSTLRRHPLVWAVHAANVSVAGGGTIDGAGPYWWPCFKNSTVRPHLMEMYNVTGLEVSGVLLRNSAYWTLHPVYCRGVHIHDMRILTPWCANYACANTDGIDVDSSSDVLIERNDIACGDDHVTVLAGAGAAGRAFGMPSRNVTVRDNTLGTGMGLSIGSSVSGGVQDVLYARNTMTEGAGQWGQGTHLKTRVPYGGYVRNVTWADSVFPLVTNQALLVETDYQSSGDCSVANCTEISGITWRNMTFLHAGSAGDIGCFPQRPCANLTFLDVHVLGGGGGWTCAHVASGSAVNVTPPGLAAACGFA